MTFLYYGCSVFLTASICVTQIKCVLKLLYIKRKS